MTANVMEMLFGFVVKRNSKRVGDFHFSTLKLSECTTLKLDLMANTSGRLYNFKTIHTIPVLPAPTQFLFI